MNAILIEIDENHRGNEVNDGLKNALARLYKYGLIRLNFQDIASYVYG
jgi:hypothetical protein